MIYGILGKGGSGKSTVATVITRALVREGVNVLAIDADHNIDFAYNLGAVELPPPLHRGVDLAKALAGDAEGDAEALVLSHQSAVFSLAPKDSFTEQYSIPLSSHVRLMVTGEQSENVLHGQTCSHSLASPLKLYLPLLDVPSNHAVVVDEKASVDAVSTGIPTGFDIALVVVEPLPHSIRVGKELLRLLSLYEVPSAVVANKANKHEVDMIAHELGNAPILSLPVITKPEPIAIDALRAFVHSTPMTRLQRSQKKFEKNRAYTNRH